MFASDQLLSRYMTMKQFLVSAKCKICWFVAYLTIDRNSSICSYVKTIGFAKTWPPVRYPHVWQIWMVSYNAGKLLKRIFGTHCVLIFHLRLLLAFSSHKLYDMPGLAPHMNALFWGPGDFPISYSNKDTSWNAWNRHSGSFMVGTRINVKWHSETYTGTVTSQLVRLFYTSFDTELDISRRGFQWSFTTGVTRQRGPLYPSRHLLPSNFGTCVWCNCWYHFYLNLPCTFRIFLGTFSILSIITW